MSVKSAGEDKICKMIKATAEVNKRIEDKEENLSILIEIPANQIHDLIYYLLLDLEKKVTIKNKGFRSLR